MKVCIVGASGVIGARLAAQHLRAGHLVTGVVFRPDSVAPLERLGVDHVVKCDVRQSATLHRAMEESDVVINAVASRPWDPARKEYCQQVVTDGFVNVARVAKVMNVAHLITLSMIDAARPLNQLEYFDESSPLPPVTSHLLDAELSACRELAASRTRHVVLRLAQVYSGDCMWLSALAQALHESKAVVVGDGLNVRQLIHTDDAVSAIMAASREMQDASLPVNAKSNNKIFHVTVDSITQAKFMAQLATAIGAAMPKKVPEFLARMRGGDIEEEMASTVTSSALFQKVHPSWKPLYRSFGEGIAQVCNFWDMVPTMRHLVKKK